MQNNRILIGTRGSQLALWQTNYVITLLRRFLPTLIFEVKIIKTTGDRLKKQNPLLMTATKGLFTKEIEEALLEGEIDIAIHSLKDLPTELPEGLIIPAVIERARPEDVLISKNNIPFFSLPISAKIGTSSLRRASQLLHLRNDLQIVPVRGNLETRIRNLFVSDYDAIVLAYAGVERLGYTHIITEVFPTELILPSIGQGTIAIECHSSNSKILEIVQLLNHEETYLTIQAERSFLRNLGGGCRTPIAGYAYMVNGEIILDGLVASPDGTHYFRSSLVGSKDAPDELGSQLAQLLLQQGAAKILEV
jgi:hydroxymethylbilane synthase